MAEVIPCSALQDISATTITLTGLPALPEGRIPLLSSLNAPSISKTINSTCATFNNGGLATSSRVSCSDLWAGQQLQQEFVLLSVFLDVYFQCSDVCNSTDLNIGTVEANSTACSHVLDANLVVGSGLDVASQALDSFIISPCLQRYRCLDDFCAGVFNLDVMAESGQRLGDSARPLALILNLSSAANAYALLHVSATSLYAESHMDGESSQVVISGANAPGIVIGEYAISFNLLVTNPSIPMRSSPIVTVVGSSGVIEGIGVSCAVLFVIATIGLANVNFSVPSQLCTDVIEDGCSKLGGPNALKTRFPGSIMTGAIERPFIQVN
jgi:hypothetical protein